MSEYEIFADAMAYDVKYVVTRPSKNGSLTKGDPVALRKMEWGDYIYLGGIVWVPLGGLRDRSSFLLKRQNPIH